jgi:hypothetical protein
MKMSNLFKKNAKVKSIGTFQKIEEEKLTKIVGGTGVVSGDLHRPPTNTVTSSAKLPAL